MIIAASPIKRTNIQNGQMRIFLFSEIYIKHPKRLITL